jgi:hypothetical protein
MVIDTDPQLPQFRTRPRMNARTIKSYRNYRSMTATTVSISRHCSKKSWRWKQHVSQRPVFKLRQDDPTVRRQLFAAWIWVGMNIFSSNRSGIRQSPFIQS